MPSDLNWFTVRLALIGVFTDQASKVVQDLQEELNMRPHLRNPQVFWETETRRVTVQVETEDLQSESAADQMAEELLEVASAVLSEFEVIRVDILSVYPSLLS